MRVNSVFAEYRSPWERFQNPKYRRRKRHGYGRYRYLILAIIIVAGLVVAYTNTVVDPLLRSNQNGPKTGQLVYNPETHLLEPMLKGDDAPGSPSDRDTLEEDEEDEEMAAITRADADLGQEGEEEEEEEEGVTPPVDEANEDAEMDEDEEPQQEEEKEEEKGIHHGPFQDADLFDMVMGDISHLIDEGNEEVAKARAEDRRESDTDDADDTGRTDDVEDDDQGLEREDDDDEEEGEKEEQSIADGNAVETVDNDDNDDDEEEDQAVPSVILPPVHTQDQSQQKKEDDEEREEEDEGEDNEGTIDNTGDIDEGTLEQEKHQNSDQLQENDLDEADEIHEASAATAAPAAPAAPVAPAAPTMLRKVKTSKWSNSVLFGWDDPWEKAHAKIKKSKTDSNQSGSSEDLKAPAAQQGADATNVASTKEGGVPEGDDTSEVARKGTESETLEREAPTSVGSTIRRQHALAQVAQHVSRAAAAAAGATHSNATRSGLPSSSGGAGRTTGNPWNVVFISVDALRRDALGCYRDESHVPRRTTTPHLDQLAASSVRFNEVYAQQAMSTPSRVSALTGMRPDTTRVHGDGTCLYLSDIAIVMFIFLYRTT